MILYKCDGESYTTGKKCESESENELPTRWLTITGKIKNGLYDAHYIECNGTRHFCSRRCLENFLFKDVSPAQDQGPLNTMHNFDPNAKAKEVKEQPADAVAPVEQATEIEQASAVTGQAEENAEEVTEG